MKKKIYKKKTSFLTKVLRKIRPFVSFMQRIWNFIQNIGKKNRRIFECLQISVIYYFALVTLMATIHLCLGYIPSTYVQLIPFAEEIMDSSVFSFFCVPDKTFIIYLLVHELIVFRAYFNFSTLIRFHILYVMTMEMILNGAIVWWDCLFNYEIDRYTYKYVDEAIAYQFFSVLLCFFLCIYAYSYIRGLQSKLPVFPHPYLQKIPDSVAFWLHLQKRRDAEK